MSKQPGIGFIIALAVLLAFPVDAMAGGFGLFKRCRPKPKVCCPPPPSCEPCPAEAPKTECWGGEAWGYYSNTQQYDKATTCCCHPNPQAAITALENDKPGLILFSYNLVQCNPPCESGEGCEECGETAAMVKNAKLEATPDKVWLGFVHLGASDNARIYKGNIEDTRDDVLTELLKFEGKKNRIVLFEIDN